MTAGSVSTAVTDVQDAADLVLEVLEGLDPALAVPAEAAQKLVDLTGGMLTKALAAFSAASGTPITPESVAALMPNPMPLTPPDAAAGATTEG